MANEQHITDEQIASSKIQKLTIKGFKSIKELVDFELKNLNIFVGANGAGKSNFISFFEMLKYISHTKLQQYMTDHGGISDVFFNGIEYTSEIEFGVHFATISADCKIHAGLNNKLDFEITGRSTDKKRNMQLQKINNNKTSDIAELFSFVPALAPFLLKNELITGIPKVLLVLGLAGIIAQGNDSGRVIKAQAKLKDIVGEPFGQVYDFYNTSSKSNMRSSEIIQDDAYLRESASNIAPFLLSIKNNYPYVYKEIINAMGISRADIHLDRMKVVFMDGQTKIHPDRILSFALANQEQVKMHPPQSLELRLSSSQKELNNPAERIRKLKELLVSIKP